MPPDVAAVFDRFPPQSRPGLLALRDAIFEIAETLPEVGTVSEELRWGQPAYLTPDTKAGTTIRLGTGKSGLFCLFVHCQTRLLRDLYPPDDAEWQIEGTRAVVFTDVNQTGDPVIRGLIRNALTYHSQPARKTG